MGKTGKKLLSVLLAIVLVIGLMPATQLVTQATGSTAYCNNFAELKRAMEDPVVTDVYLEEGVVKEFIEFEKSGSQDAIRVAAADEVKNLHIEGTYEFHRKSASSAITNFIVVSSGVTLNVDGKGSLKKSSYDKKYASDNSVFHINSNAQLHFTKDFTGTIGGVDDEMMGVQKPSTTLITVESNAHLMIENGNFHMERNGSEAGYDSWLIYDKSVGTSYVTITGGNFSGVSTGEKVAGIYGIYNSSNSDYNKRWFINNARFYTSGMDGVLTNPSALYKHDFYKSENGYVTVMYNSYNGYGKEPEFLFTDEGMPATIKCQVLNAPNYEETIQIYEIKENQSWELLDETGGSYGQVTNFSYEIPASDVAAVKYYNVVVNYAYEFGGKTYSFNTEREIRAEWRDRSYVGEGTKESPVLVSDYHQLKRAMEDVSVDYIEVDEDINYELNYLAYDYLDKWINEYKSGELSAEDLYNKLSKYDYSDLKNSTSNAYIGRELNMQAMSCVGEKHLILKNDVNLTVGNVMPYGDDATGLGYGVYMYDGNLTLSGGGTFSCKFNALHNLTDACVFRVDGYSSLTVDDAVIIGDSIQGYGYAAAISAWTTMSGTYPKVVINGGEFYGVRNYNGLNTYGPEYGGSAVYIGNEASLEVNGGVFADKGLGETDKKVTAGLTLECEPNTPGKLLTGNIRLNGGDYVTGMKIADRYNYYSLTADQYNDMLAAGATRQSSVSSISGVDIQRDLIIPAETIRQIGINGLDVPKEGQTPDYNPSTENTAQYGVPAANREPVVWYKNGQIMERTDTFEAGQSYAVAVEVYAKDGYVFATDMDWNPVVTATVGGNQALVRKVYEQNSYEYLQVYYDFGICNDSVIDTVDIAGIQTPVAGQTPSYKAYVLGTGYGLETGEGRDYWEGTLYKSNGVVWYDEEWNLLYETDTFEPGKSYHVRVHLDVTDTQNYQFNFNPNTDDVTKVTGTINGKAATVTAETSNGMWNHVVDYMFTCEKSTISQMVISDLREPVSGDTPDYFATLDKADMYQFKTANDNSIFAKNGIIWYDSSGAPVEFHEKFVEGETYRVEIQIIPQTCGNGDVCQFASGLQAYINENEVKVDDVWASSRAVYLYYDYVCQPNTSGVTVSGLLVSFGDADVATVVELVQAEDGQMIQKKEIKGNSSSYCFNNVESGNYIMRIAKNGHVTREYTLTVENENVTRNVEIWLRGDVTGDGTIDSADSMQIERKYNGKSSIFGTEDEDTENYRLKVGNVYSMDEIVDSTDAMQIQRKYNGKTSVYDY